MKKLKTQPNKKSVEKFLKSIESPVRQKDSYEILNLLKDITKREPIMWGESIIGFGSFHYKYKSGREGDWMRIGFSPRKQNLTLYIMDGFDKYDKLLGKLGKYKTGKSCLYLNNLKDIDKSVLKELLLESIKYMSQEYPENE